jgi:hypothetical protein
MILHMRNIPVSHDSTLENTDLGMLAYPLRSVQHYNMPTMHCDGTRHTRTAWRGRECMQPTHHDTMHHLDGTGPERVFI